MIILTQKAKRLIDGRIREYPWRYGAPSLALLLAPRLEMHERALHGHLRWREDREMTPLNTLL